VNTYKETDMSEENAILEAPAELPNVVAVEENSTTGASTPSVETVADTAPSVEPVAKTLTEMVEAIDPQALVVLHRMFLYIHEGFDEISLMIGMSRFYEIARAVKARAVKARAES
jgi:hypothetical protein